VSEREYQIGLASRWIAHFARQGVGPADLWKLLEDEWPEFSEVEKSRAYYTAIEILEAINAENEAERVDAAARRLAELALQGAGEEVLKETMLREFSHLTPDEMTRAGEIGLGLAKEVVASPDYSPERRRAAAILPASEEAPRLAR
jgi:hypothetical protein